MPPAPSLFYLSLSFPLPLLLFLTLQLLDLYLAHVRLAQLTIILSPYRIIVYIRAPPALQRSFKTSRNTRTKAQSASHYNTEINVATMMITTTDSAIVCFSFFGVFHHIADGELSKIQHM